MPAKDKYHDNVIHALEKDGWKVIRDQVLITIGKRHLWIDLKVELDGQFRYIEIKGFETEYSIVDYLYRVTGQYLTYLAAIEHLQLDIPLFLAVPEHAFHGILNETLGQIVMNKAKINLMVFNVEREEILQWQL